ncbi:FAD-containing monooxygenase EthA [Cercospora beticola]|uniref:FAD-containing monooxygenase EthA n=1 Tax=Cercospora beticola TaxID=122368 RepID=A0A2G5HDR1_CERBT|nr:FAD-containing monooxygenase EthA [Cercospora beticola]PIA90681.1 FAD-containing monooxygenase EthA [Cercospora beticola]WPB07805.1 hypothetical protein RHO25_012469 [Cercospora beticola]
MEKLTSTAPSPESFDFVIIGAGITGINAAYRIEQQFPNETYVILDRRGEIGGTWAFFKYPGIRSDSDLYTMGFAWRPWSKSSPIADGPGIAKYVDESAKERGIDKHIRYNHDVLSMDWSSKRQLWSLDVTVNGEKKVLQAHFIIGGTGFFDYNNPRATTIPGLEKFKGAIAHPQFWPEDLDYTNKKVVIIGSGATAITILPIVAKKASHTTMLQRSPTYIMSMSMHSTLDTWIRRLFPGHLGYRIIAWRFTILAWLFFYFSQFFPNAARKALEKATTKELPDGMKYDPDFKPKYKVWDQRLCVCPDGDFFRAMDDGKARVVTGKIEAVEEDGILLTSGEKLQADVIVTATGLKLQMLGGAEVRIDKDRKIEIGEQYMWRGTMLQSVPNLMLVIGYWNNSWTLGSDLAVRIFLKNVKEMERQRATSFVPTLTKEEESKLETKPLWNMSSTYLQNKTYPKASSTAPWTVKDNYMRDWFVMMFGDLRRGLRFERGT